MQVIVEIPDEAVPAVLAKLEANWARRASQRIPQAVSYGTFGTADRIRACIGAYLDSLIEQYEQEEELRAVRPPARVELPKVVDVIAAEKAAAASPKSAEL